MDAEKITNPMTKQECREWIVALRSGKYKQTTGALCRTFDEEVHYCCLGVETHVHPDKFPMNEHSTEMDGYILIEKHEEDEEGSIAVSYFYRLPRRIQEELADLNDTSISSFYQIADHIEQNILPDLDGD